MNIYSIYRITNITNKKVYIGFTKDPVRRWRDHRRYMKKSNLHGKLINSMKHHGIESFTFDVIYQAKEEVHYRESHTLLVMENFFIEEYNSIENGYNTTPGGKAGPSMLGANNPMYGTTRPIEVRMKVSNTLMGHAVSEETKKKQSDALKGRVHSRKTKEKMSRSRKGIPKSVEHRKNISEAIKKKWEQKRASTAPT